LTRAIRYALPIVLMLAIEPTAASAQSVNCYPIRRGESATQVARRLTGDSWNAYQQWFQIRNASSRAVPKSQYNRIRAGWRACLLKPIRSVPANTTNLASREGPNASAGAAASAGSQEALVEPVVLAAAERIEVAGPRSDSGAPSQSETWGVRRAVRGVDLTVVWLSAAIALPWFGWRILDGHLIRRKTTSLVMRHFADRFVREFERPLVLYDAERPVRTRIRYSAPRGRLDILLAPGTGRRYPNLSDHKKNVEYDVARVVRALGDESFVSGPLSMQAGWVVVPFRFKAGPRKSGVPCISSF
jgi:hypothetical protein